MGSDENHFNVSFIVRDKHHKTVSTNHKPFEEKGEPKRNRAEAFLLTSLTPCLPLGHTGSALAIMRVPAQYRPLITGCFKLGIWMYVALANQRLASTGVFTGVIGRDPHSEHCFPAPSSRLCQIWLRH